MAAVSSSTVRSLLDCWACCQRFGEAPDRTPRVLPSCAHTVCHSCVGRLLADGDACCPLCRRAVAVPAGWAWTDWCPPNRDLIELLRHDGRPTCSGCETAAAEHHCAECNGDFCSACWDRAHSLRLFAQHQRTPVDGVYGEAAANCRQHPDQRLELVCLDQQCGGVAVCLLCERKAHGGHRTVPLADGAQIKRKELQQVAARLVASSQTAVALTLHVEHVSQTIRRANDSDDSNDVVETSEHHAVTTIRQAFAEYRQRLAAAEERLIADAVATATRKTQLLAQQRAELGGFLSQAYRLSGRVARLLADDGALFAELAAVHADIDRLSRTQLHAAPCVDAAISYALPGDAAESFFRSLSAAAVHDAVRYRQPLFAPAGHAVAAAAAAAEFASVLLLGGDKGQQPVVYAAAANQWSTAADVPQLPVCRVRLAASCLCNGDVLVTGGNDPASVAVDQSYIYAAAARVWRGAAPMLQARKFHSQTTLPGGQVLVVGGQGRNNAALATAELYQPESNAWRPLAPLPEPRCGHTAVLLPSGDVLVAGGYSGSKCLASAVVYTPHSDSWRPAAAMSVARQLPAACLLPDGTALVTGGENPKQLSSCEVYDETADAWRSVKDMNQPRAIHSATLVNGRVIVAGGHPKNRTVEAYTPATDSWSLLPSMPTHRWGFAAVPFERLQ